MKKLLVLTLVLVMASLASAGVTLVADQLVVKPSDLIVITVHNTASQLGWAGQVQLVLPEVGRTGEWTGDYTVNPNAPKGTSYEVTYYGDQRPDAPVDLWYADLTAPTTGAAYPEMDYISFVFHCTAPGPAVIEVTDVDGVVLDSITILQTPEPATLALLGLGAMVLRRRK